MLNRGMAHVYAAVARAVPEITLAVAMLTRLRDRIAGPDREAGQSAAQWVVIIGVAVALALTVGGIITAKVTSKANSINLGG